MFATNQTMIATFSAISVVASSFIYAAETHSAVGRIQPVSLDNRGLIGSFTPANGAPDLVMKVADGRRIIPPTLAQKFRFTPSSPNKDERTLTVAVRQRVNSVEKSNALQVQLHKEGAKIERAIASIAPERYDLGAAKGWQSFALTGVEILTKGSDDSQRLFTLNPKPKPGNGTEKQSKKNRFNTRLSIKGSDSLQSIDKNHNLLSADGDISLDLSGSYNLSKNVAVRAGIRYDAEQYRLNRMADERPDSQAVYVGTQFKF